MADVRGLLKQVLEGEVDAFAEVVRRHQRMAFGCAFAALGDVQEAEDAVQEAFVAAYRNLSDLRDLGGFPGWLRRLVLTACNRMRRRARAETAPLASAEQVASRDGDPVRAAGDRAFTEALAEALEPLPEPTRIATLLFYIGSCTIPEIARFLGEPAGTVKYRLHQARGRLRTEMIEMIGDEFAATAAVGQTADSVLTQVALGLPSGVIIEAPDAESRTTTLILSSADARGGPDPDGLLALTLDRAVAAAIVSGPFVEPAVAEAARPHKQMLDAFAELIGAGDVMLTRVMLDVDADGQSSARLVWEGSSGRDATPVPAGAAIALGRRLKVPIFSTPRLLRRGSAGEGVPPAMDRQALALLRQSLVGFRLRDELLDVAWRNGLEHDRGSRSARIRPDEEAGTVAIYVGRGKSPLAVLELAQYRAGVDVLRRDAASASGPTRHVRAGDEYSITFREDNGDIVCTARRVRAQ